ncbi:MAG: extracellular solute-binding protein [Clostridiales bacterium]|nr:extracellular solute-binding protein [Clostridiales bacterium]
MKRSLAFLLTLLLLFAAPGAVFAEGGEPTVITVMIGEQFGAPYTNALPVVQELQKRTNTILEITNVPQTDLAVKVQTALAANDAPDIVEFWSYDDAAKYAANGVFLPLDDYLDGMDSIKALFTAYSSVEKNMKFDDGKYYILPAISDRKFLINLSVNDAWLKDLNLTAPDTLDELYDTLVKFKEAYPDAIPMGNGPYAGTYTMTQIMFAHDVVNFFFLYGDGTYQYGPYQRADNYREALRYIARLYKEGLYDNNCYSISEEEITKLITAGKLGIFASWEMYETYGTGGSWGVDYIPMQAITGPDGQKRDRGTDPLNVPFYVTNSCEDVGAVVRLADYIYSPEGRDLVNWGIEGLTFEYDANGDRQYTDLIMKSEQGSGTARYVNGLVPPHFITVRDKDAEYACGNPLMREREKLLEGIALPEQPILTGTDAENRAYTKVMNDVSKYVSETEAKFITGKLNLDGDFDAFVSQLQKMGIEDAIQIKNDQYQRWLAR